MELEAPALQYRPMITTIILKEATKITTKVEAEILAISNSLDSNIKGSYKSERWVESILVALSEINREVRETVDYFDKSVHGAVDIPVSVLDLITEYKNCWQGLKSDLETQIFRESKFPRFEFPVKITDVTWSSRSPRNLAEKQFDSMTLSARSIHISIKGCESKRSEQIREGIDKQYKDYTTALSQLRPSMRTLVFDKVNEPMGLSSSGRIEATSHHDNQKMEFRQSVSRNPQGIDHGLNSALIASRHPMDSGYKSILSQEPTDPQSNPNTKPPPRGSTSAETIYNNAPSTNTPTKIAFISDIANALFDPIRLAQSYGSSIKSTYIDLPDLLGAFALKLGHKAPTQIHRDIMYFVYKNRRDIAQYLREMCFNNDQEGNGYDYENKCEDVDQSSEKRKEKIPPNIESDEFSVMSLNKKIENWRLQTDFSARGTYETTIDDETSRVYRELLIKDPAYEWFLGKLHRSMILLPASPNTEEDIRKGVLKALPPPRKISKKQSPKAHKCTYVVEWNPLTFIAEQGYEVSSDEAIERAITLTGSITNAQALTCGEYLKQTWPSSGEHTLNLLKLVVKESLDSQKYDFPDRTTLIAKLQQTGLVVEVTGTRDSIAEIGEQLAWLGSALRSSLYIFSISSYKPLIRNIYNQSVSNSVIETDIETNLIIEIEFMRRKVREPFSPYNGQCWHNLFRNPVIVPGYPIPLRPSQEICTGIEIPLEMMVGITRARRITTFNEKIFIKGLSTMLVPTRRDEEGIIMWHLLYNHVGNRISYLDAAEFYVEDITFSDLAAARHIVGWCTSAKYYAGAANASYNIRSSRLPRSHDNLPLGNISIFQGQIVEGGRPCIYGHKDTPPRLLRENNMILKLRYLRDKFVLLWDEDQKRGWLVNAPSGLLHLVRASLHFDSNDEFSSEFLFEQGCMQEANQPYKVSSAIEVLKNDKNLKYEIYSDQVDEARFFVKDRVAELYDTLTKMIDYQIGLNRNIINPKARSGVPRKYLEGWDFHDIATCRDPIFPRFATLDAKGKSWVDFTRNIHTVSLFGRGFGEIIQQKTNSCEHWLSVPTGMYYLAAHVDDLKKIMDRDGDEYAIPMRLTDNIIWYIPQSDIGQCECKDKQDGHSDLAQVLFPSKLQRSLPLMQETKLNDGGAVIFGQNANVKWFWKDIGDPEKGDPEEVSTFNEDPESSFHDSGIASMASDQLSFSSSTPEPASTFYTVGIVSALPKELLAIRALFDDRYEDISLPSQDSNQYAYGRIGRHHVVAACLPSGKYGTCAAADVLTHMTRSFPGVQFCLLVGIGGGIPSDRNDIRLGDVVVSQPVGVHSGVIQYDFGKAHDDGGDSFEVTGFLQSPPNSLLNAISLLRSDPDLSAQPLRTNIGKIVARHPTYTYPGQEHDKLFAADYPHCLTNTTCEKCDVLVVRPERPASEQPKIHYGIIASGNQVVKNPRVRDNLGAKYNAICVEMEAVGVMNFPCLVIRGICDYADSHKNKQWQEYAAATAAAYAKLLLSYVKPSYTPWSTNLQMDLSALSLDQLAR